MKPSAVKPCMKRDIQMNIGVEKTISNKNKMGGDDSLGNLDTSMMKKEKGTLADTVNGIMDKDKAGDCTPKGRST